MDVKLYHQRALKHRASASPADLVHCRQLKGPGRDPCWASLTSYTERGWCHWSTDLALNNEGLESRKPAFQPRLCHA